MSDDGGADQQAVYALAETKLREAAAADPAPVLRTAERNTRSMLEGLLRGLGFEQVTIRFERPPVLTAQPTRSAHVAGAGDRAAKPAGARRRRAARPA